MKADEKKADTQKAPATVGQAPKASDADKSRATILGTEIVDRWLDWWGWIPTFLVLALLGTTRSELWIAFGSFAGALGALGGAMVFVIKTNWVPKEGSRLRPVFQQSAFIDASISTSLSFSSTTSRNSIGSTSS